MSYSSRRNNLTQNSEFSFLRGIYVTMDKFFLDPILGFFIPGIGDVITGVCTVPFVMVTVFKLRSVALTLAIVRNALVDGLCGLFPVVGDLLDVFNRSYKKSYRQIIGYVDGDPEIVEEVNSGAVKACVWITVLCILIRLVVLLFSGLFGWFKGLFA